MLQINSPTTAEYEGQGHRFDPDLHFIECSRDAWTMRWLKIAINQKKYETFTAAHFMDEDPVTGMVNLELEFGKDRDSREAMQKCQTEYEKEAPKRPKVGYDEARLHQRLRTGHFFAYRTARRSSSSGKWDSHGNRWGKVQAGPMTTDGIIPWRNEIVPEEVLRHIRIIPQGQLPFSSEQFTERSEP